MVLFSRLYSRTRRNDIIGQYDVNDEMRYVGKCPVIAEYWFKVSSYIGLCHKLNSEDIDIATTVVGGANVELRGQIVIEVSGNGTSHGREI